MRRQRLTFTVAATLFLLAVVGFVLNVVKAKPVALINPTEIANFKEAGSLVLERLREEIAQKSTFVFGSYPLITDGDQVLEGIIGRGKADGLITQFVDATHNGLRPLPPKLGGERKIFYWPEDQTKLVEWIQPPQKIFFQTTSFQSHPRGTNGLALAFPNVQNILYLTEAPLYLNEQQLAASGQKCNPQSTSAMDLLFCASEQVSRKFFRKKLNTEKHWVVMERHGLNSVLIFLY